MKTRRDAIELKQKLDEEYHTAFTQGKREQNRVYLWTTLWTLVAILVGTLIGQLAFGLLHA